MGGTILKLSHCEIHASFFLIFTENLVNQASWYTYTHVRCGKREIPAVTEIHNLRNTVHVQKRLNKCETLYLQLHVLLQFSKLIDNIS